ncbi:sulfotransferase [Rhodopila sp.]|uniref:sulfotransferase n=1 Tax=Rhodopila sp. TaxID=2480087 RepID=UPI003D117AFD
MPSWAERQTEIARLADLQLFFVGGAPRSGTTWLQRLLDCHPDVSCRGEGLFQKELAAPLERMMAVRTQALHAKNERVFRDIGGYPLPAADDVDFLLATAVLLALDRQRDGRRCHAIGEKTPENVFFFAKLKHLFPAAKLICIARDPRDVLTSAWHFFHTATPGEDTVAAKTAFIRGAIPSLAEGARTILTLAERHPSDCMIITYEALRQTEFSVATELFRFLGVTDGKAVVADCLARTSFTALAGVRADGEQRNGSFFRKGVVGDWTSTLTPEMNTLVLRELGWTFPHFGWRP